MENIKDYDYNLPTDLVANTPASPRESAKLLVFNRKENKIYFDTFLNLDKYLPKNSVLVFNDTKVLPARITAKRKSGGLVKILYLKHSGILIECLAEKSLKENEEIFFPSGEKMTVVKKEGSVYFFKTSIAQNKFKYFLNKNGETPLPPYIKNSPLGEIDLRKEYQSVFAKTDGSCAAPTASLHFSQKLLERLKNSGIDSAFVTLHVGLGTFATLTEDNLKFGKLHKEYYEIKKETSEFLNKARKDGRPIVAVGTTSLRTLESAASKKGALVNLSGETDIFITPGYEFKFANHLVTNFHVPKSSLMMLVASLTGREKLLEIYDIAIKEKFRFYSFGDGMLIL